MEGSFLNQGSDFLLIEAHHPRGASKAAPPFPRAAIRATGRRRGIRGLAAWKLGWTGFEGRTAARGLARLAEPVRELAQRGRDKGVGDAQNDRIDEGDIVLCPMLTVPKEKLLSLRVNGSADDNEGRVVDIQENNGNKFARFNQLIGAALY